MTRAALIAVACAGCGDFPTYHWDDERVLCSTVVDDLREDIDWDRVGDTMESASADAAVVMLHGHVPTETMTIAALERVLDLAAQYDLAYVTYGELPTAPHRAALALSFDDSRVDAWYGIKDLLAAHGARVTFWVTRYATLSTEQRGQLHELVALGHDVQAHSANHLHAPDYARAHGLDAYLADEALPSIDVLAADGYAVTAYAFPFGASTSALDAALLDHVAFVRVGLGSCPY
jgi:hypothetical protein